MQNLQSITEIISKKCSRCKKVQIIGQFGLKGDGNEYNTCRKWRNKPTVVDNICPGSSNDHPNVIKIIEEQLVEEPKNDILKVESQEEILNNDNDPCCMLKLSEIFSDYGYRVKPLTLDMMRLVFDAMGRISPSTYLINTMIEQNYIALSESKDGVNLLFPPDEETLYLMSLNNTNLINNYTSKVKFKNKKRCQICSEKQSKHFKMCSQCKKEYCNECFIKANQRYLSCPFCRYNMKQHIDVMFKKFSEDKSKNFKCIIETNKLFSFH